MKMSEHSSMSVVLDFHKDRRLSLVEIWICNVWAPGYEWGKKSLRILRSPTLGAGGLSQHQLFVLHTYKCKILWSKTVMHNTSIASECLLPSNPFNSWQIYFWVWAGIAPLAEWHLHKKSTKITTGHIIDIAISSYTQKVHFKNTTSDKLFTYTCTSAAQ